jgi:Leucine-rich repeat (LRR) protein
MSLSVSASAAELQTSFCTLPAAFSQLSSLTVLTLRRYIHHIEPHALLHLTSLRFLALVENPTKDARDADWIYYLPPTLPRLVVTGNDFIRGGIDYGSRTQVQPLSIVPCIFRLNNITRIVFQHLQGFPPIEWNEKLYSMGLNSLRCLELSLCGLEVVPEALVGLSTLDSLCLGGNKLETLPVGPYLKNLKKLILVNNNFSSLPVEALNAATALTCLAIGGNPLTWPAAEAEVVNRIMVFTRWNPYVKWWDNPWF